jgi:hypothetical protein
MAPEVSVGKIYRAFSRIYIEAIGEFKVFWFNEGREKSYTNDQKLLESYREGSPLEKDMAECFLHSEPDRLKGYLWRTYHWGLSTSRFNSPYVGDLLVMDNVGEFSTVNSRKELRGVDLSSQNGYRLPFKVRGYGHRMPVK